MGIPYTHTHTYIARWGASNELIVPCTRICLFVCGEAYSCRISCVENNACVISRVTVTFPVDFGEDKRIQVCNSTRCTSHHLHAWFICRLKSKASYIPCIVYAILVNSWIFNVYLMSTKIFSNREHILLCRGSSVFNI